MTLPCFHFGSRIFHHKQIKFFELIYFAKYFQVNNFLIDYAGYERYILLNIQLYLIL